MLKLFTRKPEPVEVDDRTHFPDVALNEFIRIAKALGEAEAAAYLGRQRPNVGHRAVSLLLARMAAQLK